MTVSSHRWLALLLATGWGLGVSAADWPTLFGDNTRNSVSPETNLAAEFVPGTMHLDSTNTPQATNLKWRAKFYTHAYGGPVIADGRIFIGTSNGKKAGLVSALDADTGRVLWQFDLPQFITTLKLYNYDTLDLGVCSTPTIAGDRLYFVSNRDEVFCLDATGKDQSANAGLTNITWATEGSAQKPPFFRGAAGGYHWVFSMLSEKYVDGWVQDASSGSPLIDGDYVYVSPCNGVDRSHRRVPRPHTPSLIVLDKHTGKLIARDFEEVGTRLWHGEWSSPTMGVVNGKKLLFWGAGDGVCYAFDPTPVQGTNTDIKTLKVVWKFDINAAGNRTGPYWNHPAGRVGPSECIATPVFHNNRVYIAVGQDPRHKEGRGVLACIDATLTGDITKSGAVWVNTNVDRSLTTVAIKDGLLFTADFTGRIHCIDAETGKTHWLFESNRPIWSSPLIADGKVYIGTDAGDLYTFAAAKEMKLLGKTKLESPISASPIAHNGVLYVMSQKYLYAVKLGANTGAE
jgi:outer membrane protein assembly factor BamB